MGGLRLNVLFELNFNAWFNTLLRIWAFRLNAELTYQKITFSVLLSNNLTVDDLEKYYLLPDTPMTTTSPNSSGEFTHARKEVTPATSPTSLGQAYIGLITGVMAMVILLVVCTVFLMVRRGKKKVHTASTISNYFRFLRSLEGTE